MSGRPVQYRLTCSRRAGHQNATRRATTEPAEASRVAQELDGLGELGAGLVKTGYIRKADQLFALGVGRLQTLIASVHVAKHFPANDAKRGYYRERQQPSERGNNDAGLQGAKLNRHISFAHHLDDALLRGAAGDSGLQ